MKLEQKHVLAYLDGGLGVKLSQQGIFNLDSEHPNEHQHKAGIIEHFCFDKSGEYSGSFRVSDNYSFDFETGDIDLVLRPLSNLTKEIEHNGEKFVPMKALRNDYSEFWIEYNSRFLIKSKNTNMYIQLGLINEINTKLLEWKFDIFELIPNNIAVPVTDEFNPYK